MPLRVGRIPYLHCDPFYFDMARRGIELCEMVPSAVASAMENAVIDAGPVPLVECFRLGGRVDPVAGFCVASRKQAGSIFLFSTKPIQELQGASISIIGAASTAQRLLHVLLRLKYRVQPAAYVPLDLPHDAFLLVGNQGLRQRMGAPGFPHTYDLGAEWYAWTGLPFVFSRWMVRHDVDPGDKALLQDTLYVGLEEGVNALYGIAKPRVDLLMLPRDIITYIQGLHYYVGLEEEKAIERFHQYLQQVAQ